MGCGFDLGDDYDKCQILLDEYADLLTRETEEKSNDASIIVNYEQEKEELKLKIKKKLVMINHLFNFNILYNYLTIFKMI
mgnify:CR=1 FL=1